MNLRLDFMGKYVPANKEPYALTISVRFPDVIDADKLRKDVVRKASEYPNMKTKRQHLRDAVFLLTSFHCVF